MNYYQHHIGDFNNATRHLTRVERSVYRDLIELYYDKELPLPADIKTAARLILATELKDVVEQILTEFFTLETDGYHNARCDEEIGKFQSKSDSARKASAKRWHTETERTTSCNHKPITKNHKPITNKRNKSNGRFAPPTHAELQTYLNEKNLDFPPDDFIDHFTSNGWKVGGKAPMKDWKAAARRWAQRQYDFHPEKKPVKPDLSSYEPDGTPITDSEGKLL